MTTSWSHFVRGRVVRAFQANAGGALLAMLATVLGPWAVVSGCRGRWLWKPMDERVALAMTLILIAVTLADWIIRCFVLP
jgi:hypothetical protein